MSDALLQPTHDRFDGEVRSVRALGATVSEVQLRRCDGSLSFEPGQYVIAQLEDAQGRVEERPYSLCRPPEGDRFALCLQTRGGGFPARLAALTPGARVVFRGPRGQLTLPAAEDPRDLLLVATGSGVAPFRSMLDELARRVRARRCALLFGARQVDELLYDADWRALATREPGFDYQPVLSRADRSWKGHCGHVEAALAQRAPDPHRTLALLCGSAAMVGETRALLQAQGFTPSAIRTET